MKKIGLCFLEAYPSLFDALEKIAPITKSQLKKLGLNKGKFENPVKAKYEYQFSENIINYLKINPQCENDKVKVIEEDEDIIALSKPYNCHSHPLKYSDTNNVLSFIREKLGDQVLRVNASQYDRGLLYRLDYETSGLLLYSKKDFLYREFREAFSTLVEEKIYYAVVQGNFSSCSLKHKLVYGGPKASKAQAFDFSHSEGITASLEASRVEHNHEHDLTLVKVSLKEGHRHQIRVQLSVEGYPILGDVLYGGKESNRLFLHCHSYRLNGRRYVDSNMELFSLFFDLDG